MKTIEEIKLICDELKTTAEEVMEILSDEERNAFAIGFLKYVESNYIKRGNLYYFNIDGLTHIYRTVDEVMDNYVGLLNQKQ